jgi:hypothetical protein
MSFLFDYIFFVACDGNRSVGMSFSKYSVYGFTQALKVKIDQPPTGVTGFTGLTGLTGFTGLTGVTALTARTGVTGVTEPCTICPILHATTFPFLSKQL